MKNKLLIIASLLITLSVLSGCKKYLDLPPRNQRTVTTVTDMKSLLGAYLRGVYTATGGISVKGIYGAIMPMAPVESNLLFESYSDNIDFETAVAQTYVKPNNIVPGATESNYADHLLWNQYTTPTLIWKNHYEVVGYLNALIDQMDDIKDATAAQRDQILGEMYTHRAYYLLKLLQYFAPYNKADIGIPVYLHTGQGVVGLDMSRKTQAEVYSIIINDLNNAMTMVNRTSPLSGFNVFFSKRYIAHALAQVYWFKAESPAKESTDYENVKTNALIALVGVDPFIPTTANAMNFAFGNLDPNYPAVCMQNRNFGQAGFLYGNFNQSLGPGKYSPENVPLASDFCSLFKPNDIRIAAYFNMDPTRAGGKVGTAGKTLGWQWPADGDPSLVGFNKAGNSCLFKPEEAYLMLTEAYYRLNDPTNCVATLNKFKAFRNAGTATGLSGQQLLDEIINERRKELFTDTDKRWLDLKRYGNKTITRNLTFFTKAYNLTVPPNDFRYALPIPISEIQVNPNIIPNPGWVPIQY